ncbi:DegT/DnrJ/EryC1/StrS family aminotransferase [Chromobacterium violaceum]|uniref:DegT/DnrJ/EryC1/StrS family aminotransferase n=1 Tax=Chromobacterium violaceum TaxID=536 RepID=UPI001BE86E7E|nr:DegT/DnrJ/EryC1/StrS family aminotransferase [Chromobacterium violaceum]MBT2869267.1 DegT/DnrJ/EryC1/StrS family aminotransferase [Chromobacterium violaceum]
MMNNQSPVIPLVKVAMPPRDVLMPALEAVLYGGMIAEGEHVYRFEAEFAKHFGLTNALATSSGTGALHIAFEIAGAGAGTEIITTSMTAEPTNTTIMQTGAVPVFADVNPNTGNIDPASVESLITERTKAICAVHYAGYPVELTELRRIADRYSVALIEDCAHALGARFNGHPVGVFGDSAIFSFQAIKHMTTIDGGALVLKEMDQVSEARRLRWFGLSKGVPRTEVDIVRPGYKYNMHNVAGLLGYLQLQNIDVLLNRHISNGKFYDEKFSSVSGVSPAYIPEGAEPSYWLYTLLAEDSDDVERRLASIGVTASKLHRPNHHHSVFKPYRRPLPGLDEFYRKLVHIPCGWWVSEEDRARIADALSKG